MERVLDRRDYVARDSDRECLTKGRVPRMLDSASGR